jgi:UDP-N-acetylglucosamine 2-epimerase (non-hydrolysing)
VKRRKIVCVVVGTRPEAIKMAPIALALKHDETFQLHLLATGQHAEMLLNPLAFFDLVPDDYLGIMKERQSLDHVTATVITGVGDVLDRLRPSLVLVHGDTTSTLGATLAAFYRKIPVGHVEAGLRSRDLQSPFPEEMNRLLTDRLATYWFAPTPLARENLLREDCDAERIWVTGNTVIDALRVAVSRVDEPSLAELRRIPATCRLVLVTAHRRESWGKGLREICTAIRHLTEKIPELWFLVPMHRNPEVRSVFMEELGAFDRVALCEPLEYPDFVWAMKRSTLILSDSGGIQEEAPFLKKPVLVLREVTERPEAVLEGTALLVGTESSRIVRESVRLLTNPQEYAKLVEKRRNPFGDGNASERILEALKKSLTTISRHSEPRRNR